MTLLKTVIVSGSASAPSRTLTLAHRILAAVAGQVNVDKSLNVIEAGDIRVRRYGLSDFESSELVYARAESRVAQHYLEMVKSASAVVLSTPVYRATYAGGLKLLLDLIPADALRGKRARRPALSECAACLRRSVSVL